MSTTVNYAPREGGRYWTYQGRNGNGNMLGINVGRLNSQLLVSPVNSRGLANCFLEIPINQAKEVADLILAQAEINAPNSVESLMAKYGDWGEHETYKRDTWDFEVIQRDTQLGYWDWVVHQLETERKGNQAA